MNRWVLLVGVLVLWVWGWGEAQIVRPFQKRFDVLADRIDVRIVGNTLEACSSSATTTITPSQPPSPTSCATSGNNNSYTMAFVDFDGDPTTFNSSAAYLDLPAGAEVLWAGLYWGGSRGGTFPPPDPSQIGQVRFRHGTGAYQAITASIGDVYTGIAHPQDPYAAFAEVTDLVQNFGPGWYWVANVQASRGTITGGTYAGWSLVVVFRHPSLPLRHVSVYDGFFNQASSSPPTTITVSGFITPLSGTVRASLGFVVQEGDYATTGDYLELNATRLAGGSVRPSNNFFNSSATALDAGRNTVRFTTLQPSYNNLLGWDFGLVAADGALAAGSTSATVTFGTNGDGYYPQALVFLVNVFIPDLKTTFSKSVTDLNGGLVLPGDVLEYTVSFQNTGLDGATHVVLVDPIPAHTQYVPGSLRVVQNAIGAPTGIFTDAPLDDIAEYSPSCPEAGGNPCVRFRLGTGADASQGGLIPPGQGAEVRFRVQVLPSAAGNTLTNSAQVSYNSQTLGTAYNDTASASVSATVPGFSLSGRVYHDREPDGAREPSEDWSGGTTVWVKLLQGGTLVDQVQVDPGSGAYSFSGVAPGSYVLVLDDNNDPTDTAPTPPAGWLFVNPAGGSLSANATGDLSGLDFGLFHGARLSGTVFYDDGEGGGTANDALRQGGERGVPGVAVTAQGSGALSATTDGQGRYVLYIPWNFGPFTLSHPLRPATGWNDGGAAHPVSGWAEAQNPFFPTLDAGSMAGTQVERNFGVVREGRLYPSQSGQAGSPGVVVYPHLYKPGTLGDLALALGNAPSWSYQARLDGNCDGDFNDPGEGFSPLPQALAVGPSWPREADGSLKACALEVRVLVPSGVPAGEVDVALLQAELVWANNPGVKEIRDLSDTTTVAGGEVRLTKQVRNVTQGTAFGTVGEGKPNEVLEYCIAYRNLGTAPVSQFLLTDPVPFFTDPLLSVPDYGGKALRWTHGSTVQYLTATSGDDAGEVVSGTVRVAVGNVGPGEAGEVCYRVRIR